MTVQKGRKQLQTCHYVWGGGAKALGTGLAGWEEGCDEVPCQEAAVLALTPTLVIMRVRNAAWHGVGVEQSYAWGWGEQRRGLLCPWAAWMKAQLKSPLLPLSYGHTKLPQTHQALHSWLGLAAAHQVSEEPYLRCCQDLNLGLPHAKCCSPTEPQPSPTEKCPVSKMQTSVRLQVHRRAQNSHQLQPMDIV